MHGDNLLLRAWRRNREAVALAAILIAVLVAMSFLSRYFLSLYNLLDSTRFGSEIGLVALGMSLPILLGGIDLSVGSTFAMSAVAMGMAVGRGGGPGAALFVCLAVGLALGAVNGLVVTRLSVPPIIATLGTMSLYRGLAMGASRGDAYRIPPSMYDLAGGATFLGLPLQFIVFLLASLAVLVMLGRTTLGRSLVATGNNPVAARFSGVNVGRVTLAAYALSGLFCGLAAFLFASRVTSAKADFGIGYELDALIIVLLGGATLKGGKANVLGSLLGMLIVIMTRRGLTMALVGIEIQTIIFGLLLLAVVGLRNLLPAPRNSE